MPCREEFPLLSRLQTRHRRAGLSVLGVSTDFQKEKPAVEKFLVEQKPSFPNYRKKSGGDDQKFIEAVDSSWGGELPFSVLYDRSGRKVRVFSGELEIAALEKQIVSLLAARAPAPANRPTWPSSVPPGRDRELLARTAGFRLGCGP